MNIRNLACATAFSAGALFAMHHAGAAEREAPPRHPAYMQAIADLKAAQWNLSHRAGDDAVSHDEKVALTEVDRAIDEARVAAYEDARDLEYTPPTDEIPNRAGRLQTAAALLQRAKVRLEQAEDNHEARQVLRRVEMHVDHGLHATELALADVHARH
ncbi:MAG TPA: hypothetical protein VGN52_00225 [Burkholderiales bacterium]